MSPSDADVVATFRARVNMTADELAAWLDDPESADAGTGVGLDSGRHILAILRKNPAGEPAGYDEEDVKHMRKVVAYLARHLAQEGHLKDTKTTDELAHTKSTISLKNWGHDPVKVKLQEEGGTDETEEDDDGGSGSADEKVEKVDADADADAAKPATRSQDRRKSARGAKAGVSAGAKRKRGDADGVAEHGESRGGDEDGNNDDDAHVDDADVDADADYDVDDGKGDEEASSGEDAEDGPRPAVQRKTEAGGESIDEEPEA